VDVERLLEVLAPAGARLDAGSAGTLRPVRRTRLATSVEALRALAAGDLGITTLDALDTPAGGDDDMAQLVARLERAGVAGLVLGRPGDEAPRRGLLAAADGAGLPVITAASGDGAIADLVMAVMEAFQEAQQQRLAAIADSHERFAALSLEELIAGHLTDTADVAERAAAFGWDLARPRAVLLASIDPPEQGELPAHALGTIVAAARATLGRDAIVWSRRSEVAALVAPATDDPGERRAIAEGLRRELDARVRSVAVSVGVGRRVPDPSLLPRSFAEASRAVDVGRWAKGRHVTEVFDQLGLERLLAAAPEEDLVDFVRHAIGALLDHDRATGAGLVDTLAVWLETRNMAEAARRMHVHYNTLKNRLDRIEDVLGPVLGDPARALECEVAIHIVRHDDVPWDGGRHAP
jgi:purine catabolism regulator